MQAIRTSDAVGLSVVISMSHCSPPEKTLDIVELVRGRPSPEMVWQLKLSYAVWESCAGREQLLADPRMKEPTERLQLVSRLALRWVRFTADGRETACRSSVGRLRGGGQCGRKENLAVKANRNKSLHLV